MIRLDKYKLISKYLKQFNMKTLNIKIPNKVNILNYIDYN